MLEFTQHAHLYRSSYASCSAVCVFIYSAVQEVMCSLMQGLTRVHRATVIMNCSHADINTLVTVRWLQVLSLDHKHHGIRFPGGITALLHNRLCDLNQSYYSNHIRAGQSWPNGQSVGFVTQWSRVRVSSLLCVCVCVCVHTHALLDGCTNSEYRLHVSPSEVI